MAGTVLWANVAIIAVLSYARNSETAGRHDAVVLTNRLDEEPKKPVLLPGSRLYAKFSASTPVIIAPYPHLHSPGHGSEYFRSTVTSADQQGHGLLDARGGASGLFAIGLEAALNEARRRDQERVLLGDASSGVHVSEAPIGSPDKHQPSPTSLLKRPAEGRLFTSQRGTANEQSEWIQQWAKEYPDAGTWSTRFSAMNSAKDRQMDMMDALQTAEPAGPMAVAEAAPVMPVPADEAGMPFMDLPCDSVVENMCKSNPNCCKTPLLAPPVPPNSQCVSMELGAGECEFARQICHKCGFCGAATSYAAAGPTKSGAGGCPFGMPPQGIFEKQFAMEGSPVLVRIQQPRSN